MTTQKKWLLLDGYNLAYRSFYAIPELSRSDGFPTNAIHGWLRTIWYLQSNYQTKNIIVFFDLDGSSERQILLPDYKKNRQDTPPNLVLQFPYLKQLSQLLGYPVIEQSGIEADDLIASMASQLKSKGDFVYIVSADKDFGQILQDNIVQLLPPPTQNPKLGWRVQNPHSLYERLEVHPHELVDYLSLIGDQSDNIPGIPGVGPKTAAKWIRQYGSLNAILQNLPLLKPLRFQSLLETSKDTLFINQKMITLNTSLPLSFDQFNTVFDLRKLFDFFKLMEMHKALHDAEKIYLNSDQIYFDFNQK